MSRRRSAEREAGHSPPRAPRLYQVAADLDQLPIPSPPAPCARVRVVRALPTRGPMQRVAACTVTTCADVCVYKLDQWRSSNSSTDISATHFNFKEGQMTLLTHVLHRASSASSETWSGGC